MMRKCWLISLLMLSMIPATAQDSTLYGIFPMKSGKVFYDRILAIDSALKDDLFNRAMLWGENTLQKDANKVNDKETGFLEYHHFFSNLFHTPKILSISATVEWKYWQTLKLLVNDHYARIVVTDIELWTSAVGSLDASSGSIETLNRQFESLARSMGWNKSYRERWWNATRENLVLADNKIRLIMASLEAALKEKQPADPGPR